MITKIEIWKNNLEKIIGLNDRVIQYNENNYRTMPEFKLACAIFNKAIEDYCMYYKKNHDTYKNYLFNDARAWIFSGDNGKMSFKYICNILEKDYLRLRSMLLSKIERRRILKVLVSKNNRQGTLSKDEH